MTLEKAVSFNQEKQLEEIKSKKGVLQNTCSPGKENQRCLECNYICNICVEVCPNRANIAVGVNTKNLNCRNQIIHLDGICNECGNCVSFCPYDSAPYQDKFTLYWNQADFTDSQNAGFVLIDAALNQFKIRLGENLIDVVFDLSGKCQGGIPNEIAEMIRAAYKDYRYLFV